MSSDNYTNLESDFIHLNQVSPVNNDEGNAPNLESNTRSKRLHKFLLPSTTSLLGCLGDGAINVWQSPASPIRLSSGDNFVAWNKSMSQTPESCWSLSSHSLRSKAIRREEPMS